MPSHQPPSSNAKTPGTPAWHAEVTQATAQGDRRYHEDRTVCEWIELPPRYAGGTGQLLAVMDGHNGADTAEKARWSLPVLFKKALQDHPGNVPEAFRDTIGQLADLTAQQKSGSTLSAVYIPGDRWRAYVAILGDSPVLIVDDQGHLHQSPEHNIGTNTREKMAAEARGATFFAGYLQDPRYPHLGLQMSRCLGDRDFERVLDRTPEIYEVALGPASLVIVGSYGLWTPFEERLVQAEALVQAGREKRQAQAIVDLGLAGHSGDNATAILWLPQTGPH